MTPLAFEKDQARTAKSTPLAGVFCRSEGRRQRPTSGLARPLKDAVLTQGRSERCADAAKDRDLRLIDLLETQHGAHPLTFLLPKLPFWGTAAVAMRTDVPLTVRKPAACRVDR